MSFCGNFTGANGLFARWLQLSSTRQWSVVGLGGHLTTATNTGIYRDTRSTSRTVNFTRVDFYLVLSWLPKRHITTSIGLSRINCRPRRRDSIGDSIVCALSAAISQGAVPGNTEVGTGIVLCDLTLMGVCYGSWREDKHGNARWVFEKTSDRK